MSFKSSFLLIIVSLLPGIRAFVGKAYGSKSFYLLQVHTSMTSLTATSLSEPTSTARSVLGVVSARYPGGNWTRLRNYVYRNKDRLTLEQIESVLDFLEERFPLSLVRTILETSPRIIRKAPNTNLEPTVIFLQQLYGVRFQEAISKNPDLLLSSGLGFNNQTNYELVTSFLTTELALKSKDVAKLERSALFFFQSAPDRIRGVVQYLTLLLKEGGIEEHQAIIQKLLLAHPHIFHLSVETNLRQRVDFLRGRCQLEPVDVAYLLKFGFGILGLSVEDNLQPTLDYLAQLVTTKGGASVKNSKVAATLLHKCVMAHPQILGLSQVNMEQKVKYFESIGTGLAARIVTKSPVVMSLSLSENISPTVSFLAKIWGENAPKVSWEGDEMIIVETVKSKVDNAYLHSLLSEYPSVLTLSLEGNIQPTMNFFNKTAYTKLDDEWCLIGDARRIRGRYIAASLFQRLLPRWHFAVLKKEVSPPPLHHLVTSSDERFCQVLCLDLKEFLEFKREEAPRLKFSSQFDTWLKTGRAIDI
jgi:hypothetical protein